MGTLSKAIPASGGYIASSRRICEFLALQARSYIYSGALPPAAAAAALEGLRVMRDEPERIASLRDNIRYFRAALQAIGLSYGQGETAIFPVICGDDWAAFRLASFCQKRGFYVQAIPYPVVPKGQDRLRVSINAGHRKEDLDLFVAVLDEGLKELDGEAASPV
jgi:7-keto-8-aminopelargonate synthetase-like enzyme